MLLSVSVLVTVCMAGLALVDVAIARHRAASAADLAALAGAQAAVTSGWSGLPSDDAAGRESCAAAHRVAAAQRTALAGCRLEEDGTLDVIVTADVGPWLAVVVGGSDGQATARARAGPAGLAGPAGHAGSPRPQ